MKIELEFAELHNPLFLGGRNLQMKLDPSRLSGLTLCYDRDEKELLVGWGNKLAIVPSSNVASMVPKDWRTDDPIAKEAPIKTDPVPAQVKPDPKKEAANLVRGMTANKQGVPLKAIPNKSAQVGGPSDHVFSDGPGKVRD